MPDDESSRKTIAEQENACKPKLFPDEKIREKNNVIKLIRKNKNCAKEQFGFSNISPSAW